MPTGTPVHARTAALCTSYLWKEWAGYYAVRRFEHSTEPEYMALRHTCGLLDVTPLFKYDLRGPGAGEFLSRVTVRDLRRLKVGRVTYACWCDDAGKVVDDGTIARLGEEHFRLTAAEPTLGWLTDQQGSADIDVLDATESLVALAIQGPMARSVLLAAGASEAGTLPFFAATPSTVGGVGTVITRTGYTGDLGFEIWAPAEDAIDLWDRLVEAGRAYGLRPAGLDALDITRIEAGFVMLDVDYYSAAMEVLDSRKSSPYELGLGWMVKLERDPFVGQEALRRERRRGTAWSMVGLEADWDDLLALYDRHDLPPHLPIEASRDPLPVFADGEQVGRATSHVWSPLLKKSIALASVRTAYARMGTVLALEHTVEFERQTVRARVVPTPFYDPPRKRKP